MTSTLQAPSSPLRLPVFLLVFLAAVASGVSASAADTPPAKDSALVKMLKGGKLPEPRQGAIITMIGKRGGPADLDFLFGRALDPNAFSTTNRRKALEALADAASTRNVRPLVDLQRLERLIASREPDSPPEIPRAAVRLAGLWKVQSLGGPLRSMAASAKTSVLLRAEALDALASMGDRASIEALAAPGSPPSLRVQAITALTRLDVQSAARLAAHVLRDADQAPDKLGPLLAAFLNRRDGADTLASALAAIELPRDAARVALREVYTLGRSDPSLVSLLSRAAGIDAEVQPLDRPAMDQLIADVASRGNPARGESIFRRADLNCIRCHALSGAGGGVGPDLSAVGASSPVDYLINSILLPDQAIKEEFHTLVVLTASGQVYQGIVVDRDSSRIILREATGDSRTIPASEIEESKEGGSLMPRGLANFLTRAELVDLVRFLSELGKPGPYAIRSSPTIQRWRTLSSVPDLLAKSPPDPETFRKQVRNADPAQWLPAYARTAGDLPLDELTGPAVDKVLYLQADVEVSHPGKVNVRLDSSEGVNTWVDDQPAPRGSPFTVDLATGRHTLTFRVDTAARSSRSLKGEVLKPPGSTIEYSVIGGR
ncbi:MAG: hypothetical protein NVSMB9_29510 [Isosphaeraceae bacterium]